METLELFYPQIVAHVGPYSITEGIEFEICSAKSSYFDWAKIHFTEQYQPALSLARKDSARIELGYNGVMEDVFAGYVTRPYNNSAGMDEITLKDEMLLLEETQINNTFLNTTPQEMLTYFLKKAGIEKMVLSQQTYPERRQVPIWQMSVIQAINRIHAAWAIKQPFFFLGDTFYWGERPEQEKIYTFEYGVNILSLDRFGGMWVLETVSAPFIHHSQVVRIIHPKVSGEVEVLKVITATNDNGFIRTKLYFQ